VTYLSRQKRSVSQPPIVSREVLEDFAAEASHAEGWPAHEQAPELLQ